MNETILKCIFRDDYLTSHVTSFVDDPSNIHQSRRGICWAGRHYNGNPLATGNQYFTISRFEPSEGKAVRRKSNFIATYVIVLDDVVEKLPQEQVERLPIPTFKIQTSATSWQWFWVLNTPCSDMGKVDNLHDGLILSDLVPSGNDPGQKGVTRYCRLPDGFNSKANRLADGAPFDCQLVDFYPWWTVTIEDLAAPFGIDLNEKRPALLDGASEINHPIKDVLNVKEIKGNGQYDVTCPWVDDHTRGGDDGAMVFSNADYSIGFRCHHGHCSDKTGADVIKWIDERNPGWSEEVRRWKVYKAFGFTGNIKDLPPLPVYPKENPMDNFNWVEFLTASLKKERTIEQAFIVLKMTEKRSHVEMIQIWKIVRKLMRWSVSDLKQIMKEQRYKWYIEKNLEEKSFMDNCKYVAEQDKIYHVERRMWMTPAGFKNMYCHVDKDILSIALEDEKIEKVHAMSYLPGKDTICEEEGMKYVNSWKPWTTNLKEGDISLWLNHFAKMEWEEHETHIIQWLAFTLQHPEQKINHSLLFAGHQGGGKDFLLYPLMKYLGRDAETIHGNALLSEYNEYLMSTKLLLVNELSLGTIKDGKNLTNKLKPLNAAPPEKLKVYQKWVGAISVKNLVNVVFTSNSALPIRLDEPTRRFYAIWSEYVNYGADGSMLESEEKYFDKVWAWIKDNEGWRCVIHYLMNIDLSDFSPESTPAKTEFTKEIEHASEDPMFEVIRSLIELEIGMFVKDIMTPSEIQEGLKQGLAIGMDVGKIPPIRYIGRIMRQSALGKFRKTQNKRLWIVRNHDKYKGLRINEIEEAYKAQ